LETDNKSYKHLDSQILGARPETKLCVCRDTKCLKMAAV